MPFNNVIDNFTRADENPMVTSSNGTGWLLATDAGTFSVTAESIVSNRCVANSVQSIMYLNTTYSVDTEASVTVGTVGATSAFVDLGVRINTPNLIASLNGYGIRWTVSAGTDTIQIVRVDVGPVTNVLTTYNQDVSAGDSIGITAVGNLLTAYYKPSGGGWTPLGSTTDGTYSGTGTITLSLFSNTTGALSALNGGTFVPPASRLTLLGVG